MVLAPDQLVGNSAKMFRDAGYPLTAAFFYLVASALALGKTRAIAILHEFKEVVERHLSEDSAERAR